MIKLKIEKTDKKMIPRSGLGLVGLLLSQTDLINRLNNIIASKEKLKVSNSDVAISYLGLLCQGSSEFEYIEKIQDKPFFHYALDINQIPSCSTLHQHLNCMAVANLEKSDIPARTILMEESANLVKDYSHLITPITLENKQCYIPLDVGISSFHNTKIEKKRISLTGKMHDDYAPILAYLGREGFGVNVELRNRKTYGLSNTSTFLYETIKFAKTITKQPLLLRLDSTKDNIDNLDFCQEISTAVDFIIKQNSKQETADDWLNFAKEHGKASEPREGKTVYRGTLQRKPNKANESISLVFEVIEQTIDADGQIQLIPAITFDTYWTTLEIGVDEIISLYHNHDKMEQFHSEIKTGLSLEYLPSNKFATNDLVLHLGLFTYNLLRIIGQENLELRDQSKCKQVKRRRIQSVIKLMINHDIYTPFLPK